MAGASQLKNGPGPVRHLPSADITSQKDKKQAARSTACIMI